MSGNDILTSIKGHHSDTNLRKLTGNNPNLDLVNTKAYRKFSEILSISLKLKRKQKYTITLLKSKQNMTGSNLNIDIVNVNAYIKLGEILSTCSQAIERT